MLEEAGLILFLTYTIFSIKVCPGTDPIKATISGVMPGPLESASSISIYFFIKASPELFSSLISFPKNARPLDEKLRRPTPVASSSVA